MFQRDMAVGVRAGADCPRTRPLCCCMNAKVRLLLGYNVGVWLALSLGHTEHQSTGSIPQRRRVWPCSPLRQGPVAWGHVCGLHTWTVWPVLRVLCLSARPPARLRGSPLGCTHRSLPRALLPLVPGCCVLAAALGLWTCSHPAAHVELGFSLILPTCAGSFQGLG